MTKTAGTHIPKRKLTPGKVVAEQRQQAKAEKASRVPKPVGRPKGSTRADLDFSKEDHELVEVLVAMGATREQTARLIKNPKTGVPIHIETLEKYFSDELENGFMRASAKVVGALFRNAVNEGNVAAQIFWCKAKLNFREVQRNEIVLTADDLDKLIGDLERNQPPTIEPSDS